MGFSFGVKKVLILKDFTRIEMFRRLSSKGGK